MRYEHLIQINDPHNPTLIPLRRDQLWVGLLLRAEQPEEFLVGVERMRILARGVDWLEREMYLGNLRVHDRITLLPGYSVHFATSPSEVHGGGQLTLQIEEPQHGDLFVRFTYETALSEEAKLESDAGDAYFADYVKNAYKATDIDSIRTIRRMAAEGLLDMDAD